VDLLPVLHVPGVTLIEGNFLDPLVVDQVLAALGGGVDIVMSDMAASSTGHSATDHLKIMALLEAALECAEDVLTAGGSFVAKVLQGGTEQSLLIRLKGRFTKVAHFKPKSSRKDSAESYVVALGFKTSERSTEHAS
jgi:23S rRNA (uridine2552-2'-O)-methyltransferase